MNGYCKTQPRPWTQEQTETLLLLKAQGLKSFKRLDFVHQYYGIDKLQNFTTHNLIAEVQRIAARQKKKTPAREIKEWRGISRVYFTIEKIKITEQWENRDKGQDSAAVNAET